MASLFRRGWGDRLILIGRDDVDGLLHRAPGRADAHLRMEIDVDTELAPLSLAAARALFRAPQAEDACWADVHMPDGTVRACGRPEATNLGLCAEHRVELFGLEAS
jgi:hypothetical protein